MKITLTEKAKIQFLKDMIDEYGQAAYEYGAKIDRPGEEIYAQHFEDESDRLLATLDLVFGKDDE